MEYVRKQSLLEAQHRTDSKENRKITQDEEGVDPQRGLRGSLHQQGESAART
jgi:hypothetical protein